MFISYKQSGVKMFCLYLHSQFCCFQSTLEVVSRSWDDQLQQIITAQSTVFCACKHIEAFPQIKCGHFCVQLRHTDTHTTEMSISSVLIKLSLLWEQPCWISGLGHSSLNFKLGTREIQTSLFEQRAMKVSKPDQQVP